MDCDEPIDYDQNLKDPDLNVIFVRGPNLSKVFNELEKSAEEFEFVTSPNRPHFKITTVGIMQAVFSVEVAKTSPMMMMFNCKQTVVARYKSQQIRMTNKAMQSATKFELIGERYFYIERSVEQNWTTAATTCRQMGGYLASIRSEEELRAISMKVNDYTCYYLGMNDHEVRGNFVSLASGRPAALMWTQNEPDYIPGGESCVAIYNDSEKGMMMVPCSNESNFICQADVET
ncbi:GD22824 [Drosophila simulans]|uniref:GD22824 n=1 Tax=Drosophila simulans TaxID=7240 RepID=B4Q860_DROSI|nr:GD22824 [Drosophila simulans]